MGEEKKRTAREIIENYDGAAVRIMEVCGTHTHEIFRLGIRKLLPPQVELISGPRKKTLRKHQKTRESALLVPMVLMRLLYPIHQKQEIIQILLFLC